MTLATHQFKGSCSILSSVPSSWSSGCKLKYSLPRFNPGWREDRFFSLKSRLCSSIGSSLVLGPKSKSSKVLAFKGNSQYDDSNGRVNGSKPLKNAVKVSYLQNKNENSSVESSNVQKVVPNPYKEVDETTTQFMEGVIEEPSSTMKSEIPNTKHERGDILEAVCCYFLGLDATVKIPLVLFTPLYFAVLLVYGSKVTKELAPLWIIGPLIVALNIKMFQAMCGLCAFSFQQTVEVGKNVIVYYLLVHSYIFHGKLKVAMRKHIFQPIADMKNMGFSEVMKRKVKDIQGWLWEIYLDFLELIWPYYCRTFRFFFKWY